ncbi:hypothetical protein [Bradyrhizobium sp. STM 3562]|uniref:hypothetical protein n=1 Tax=Bradyrhizobium sp. STM 3562 TaxID=578924 RepID=UPI00388D22B0
MMTMKLAIAALVTVGLAAAPFAAEAKKHRQVRRHIPIAQAETYGMSGISATQPRTYGTSGNSVGTVTAPSVGSYNWPSVGVTNSVPTWSNTNPGVRR